MSKVKLYMLLFLCMSSTSNVVDGRRNGGRWGNVRRGLGGQYLSNVVQAGGVGLLVEHKQTARHQQH